MCELIILDAYDVRWKPHESQRKFHNFLQHGTFVFEKSPFPSFSPKLWIACLMPEISILIATSVENSHIWEIPSKTLNWTPLLMTFRLTLV